MMSLQARQVARELALLSLYQTPHEEGLAKLLRPAIPETVNQALLASQSKASVPVLPHLHKLIRLSMATLHQFAQDTLQESEKPLLESLKVIERIEYDYQRTVRTASATVLAEEGVPVPVEYTNPKTKPMKKALVSALQSLEAISDALRLPELVYMSGHKQVQAYCGTLLQTLSDHYTEVNTLIGKYAHGWRLDRLNPMDRCVLQLALTELLYIEEVDAPVTMNEMIMLAKRYSTEESYRFVNGILRSAMEDHQKKQESVNRTLNQTSQVGL
ncbi:MAG: transcription antitermination factor NusB [Vampirovibrionales bacterium]